MQSSPIPWSSDVSPARWVTGLLGSSLTSIDWVVPLVYDAYVRLERPDLADGATRLARHLIARLRRLEATTVRPGGVGSPVGESLDACWFAVADLYGWNGHDPLPDARFTRLSSDDAALLRADPVAFLESRMSRASVEERGDRASHLEPYPYAMAETGNRSYMLFPGPIEHALGLPAAGAPTEIPDLWWPADRAWFLGGDTDFGHLFLGGTRTLIDHLLADPDLHATEISPDPAPD